LENEEEGAVPPSNTGDKLFTIEQGRFIDVLTRRTWLILTLMS
jgi:hypothetical protein